MFNENLKQLRKSKGLSQEELASKLHVVRQTVSKWEKGLSVPDSEMLIEISNQFEVSVSTLLGETVDLTENSDTVKIISEKLALINEQLAKNAERNRKLFRGISIAGLTAVLVYAVIRILTLIHAYLLPLLDEYAGAAVIGGADGPTAIFVSVANINVVNIAIVIAILSVSICGVYLTRRK